MIPIQLDVTEQGSIAQAARTATGVSILINNAGSSTRSSLLTGTDADIRTEMETHYSGSLFVTRAFAPQLAEADGSAVLNIGRPRRHLPRPLIVGVSNPQRPAFAGA